MNSRNSQFYMVIDDITIQVPDGTEFAELAPAVDLVEETDSEGNPITVATPSLDKSIENRVKNMWFTNPVYGPGKAACEAFASELYEFCGNELEHPNLVGRDFHVLRFVPKRITKMCAECEQMIAAREQEVGFPPGSIDDLEGRPLEVREFASNYRIKSS